MHDNGHFPEHLISPATSHITNFKQIAEIKIDRPKHELNNVTKDTQFSRKS
jgi:3-hydroxymyristoyl/3-hydroxydecanoyl-(acyl carrier protein) dehydratase